MTRVDTSTAQDALQVSTSVNFNIIGNNEQIFAGKSQRLSPTDLAFMTNTQLKKGMLLQVTMASHQNSSPSLQTMVEVVHVDKLDDAADYQYQIDSNIKDIAIGI